MVTRIKPTGREVWEAVLTDPKFTTQMPEGSPQREAVRPFIEASVQVLGEQLKKIVTFQDLAGAKATFLRYCVENNYGEVMGAVGRGVPKGFFEQLIDIYESIHEDVTPYRESYGTLIAQMNPTNQQKWRTRTLTIGELLLTQPLVILADS